MKKQIAPAYPTFIGQFMMDDADQINQELKKVILEREAAGPSQQLNNVGGWHSASDLLNWPQPCVQTLRSWVFEAVNDMIKVTVDMMRNAGMPQEFNSGMSVAAWANVSRNGNYHRVHNHPNACWSGAYYVSSGERSPDSPGGGQIEFFDPRPFTEMVQKPGNPYGQRVTIPPQEGKMVLFPSWLYHAVTPFVGTGERISISFNARVA